MAGFSKHSGIPKERQVCDCCNELSGGYACAGACHMDCKQYAILILIQIFYKKPYFV
jgi:hypothetical protein